MSVGLTFGVPYTALSAVTTTGASKNTFAPTLTRVVNYFTSGTFSVCTVDLERSIDNGATWVTMLGQTGMGFFANPNGTLDCPFGAMYRLNVKTFTGTSITVQLSVDS